MGDLEVGVLLVGLEVVLAFCSVEAVGGPFRLGPEAIGHLGVVFLIELDSSLAQ